MNLQRKAFLLLFRLPILFFTIWDSNTRVKDAPYWIWIVHRKSHKEGEDLEPGSGIKFQKLQALVSSFWIGEKILSIEKIIHCQDCSFLWRHYVCWVWSFGISFLLRGRDDLIWGFNNLLCLQEPSTQILTNKWSSLCMTLVELNTWDKCMYNFFQLFKCFKSIFFCWY